MRILETKVYTFEELSEEAKEKAIENYRYLEVELFDWYEPIYDMFKDTYSDLFEITDMYFSGFCSQGDGAMFEYSGVTEKLIDEFIAQLELTPLRKKIVKDIFHFRGSGKQHGHYYHEKCCWHIINIECTYAYREGYYPNIDEFMYELQVDFDAYVREKYIELAQQLYQWLEDEYEYLTNPEDEAIELFLQSIDYEYNENGERII